MRICHVSISLKTGGLERLLAGMAAHADRNELDMDFVSIREEGRFAEEIRKTGARVETLGKKNRWQMVFGLKRLFEKHRYDIVHTHNVYPHIYGTLAARLAKVPVVINTRHGQHVGHGWKSRFLCRLAGRWSARMVAVSDDSAALSVHPDGLPRSKVTRIWNGIDVSEFEYRGSSGKPVAVTVARLAPEKDLATLIQSMPMAIQQVPELRLRIIGDGELRADLENQATRLGLSDKIQFMGERSDIPALLGECGFYVSSSLTEGISLTILEAMAVGLPVVATNVGGNPEIIVEPEMGFLVPPADPAALAQGMVRLCNERLRWAAMGQAARQRVIDHFDMQQMVANYQALYRELLGQTRR